MASMDSKGMDTRTPEISQVDLRRMIAFRCAAPFLADPEPEQRNYRNLSMEELEAAVVPLMNPNRVRHILGCRDMAAHLARLWGADETDAARAGLLHDITKALGPELQLTLCREYGVRLDKFSRENPKTLHALTGALVAERIFGENPAVVAAIRSHTTGKADMNTLEKIIYVADYTEPNRDFPGVEEMRSLSYCDLDGALRSGLCSTVSLLRQQGREICPESLACLEYLNKEV